MRRSERASQRSPSGSPQPLLIFDGDCSFCTTSVRWLEAAFPGSFAVVPYQRTNLASLALTEQQCRDRIQWVAVPSAPSLGRRDGARAVSALLRRGGQDRGGLSGIAALTLGRIADVPPISLLSTGIYALVAANRHRLPGGTPACRM
ncbi:MAG: DCC1-like thiol-disulfide oxidoreductase family protein [Actinomycetes bacterium]